MPKYIDAKKFIKKLDSPKVKAIVGVVGIAWVKALLAKIPEVDAVEVVRCKNCQKRYQQCFDKTLNDNDFCSYGERKESEVQGE